MTYKICTAKQHFDEKLSSYLFVLYPGKLSHVQDSTQGPLMLLVGLPSSVPK
jgi:hypothetical protein